MFWDRLCMRHRTPFGKSVRSVPPGCPPLEAVPTTPRCGNGRARGVSTKLRETLRDSSIAQPAACDSGPHLQKYPTWKRAAACEALPDPPMWRRADDCRIRGRLERASDQLRPFHRCGGLLPTLFGLAAPSQTPALRVTRAARAAQARPETAVWSSGPVTRGSGQRFSLGPRGVTESESKKGT